MLFALGAVSSALDAIQSLTNAKSSSAAHKTGSSQSAPTNPFAIDSGSSSTTGATSSVNAGKYPQISAETMNALFAAQGQSANGTSSSSKGREAALKDLFSQIDADADGKITKSEFEDALGAGGTNLAQADDVFSKMDANADGSVNLGEMTKALRGGHGRDHAEGAGDGSDSSSQSSRGSTSTTTTNADGSTTTTVTYDDGFKMSTTVPGAASSSHAKGGGNSPYDWFGQMMQRQAQATAGSAASSMSISV
ncbi:EF-hand domain-containing protein [Bradyrhizobium sp. NBAIM20]|uniref:EF-hand domain-containing protein n=1 Tax=unclassified Bradyrhizobium TaxID=2631580 RepID=UPI001CD545E7|nr:MULTISPECIES: EF-hand domain-containing protein [unclassified Bradyrhizobium]MCA1414847.1 EF-hand domain-containing protein [Bradyrhizobium sp. NBAIM20]MCA1461412.1 EF-hand domain-containing protein [Bradyrhizobium sp. NBAIM18]